MTRYIDRETARVDTLIKKKTRFIELLKEKRQALITHAVTKGLNPEAPMKDSGIEWLGQVPAHWVTAKCGRYMETVPGFAFPSEGFTRDDGETRLLRGINVGVGTIKWDDTVYWRRHEGDGLDRFALQAGDIVIGMDRPQIGDGMRVATISTSDLPSLLLQRVALVRPDERLAPKYLYYLLSSEMFVAHFSPETTGISVPHISADQIRNFVIPVPDRAEQDEIVKHIESALGKITGLLSKTQCSIELLNERRSALITAAVTGKIDLRDAA